MQKHSVVFCAKKDMPETKKGWFNTPEGAIALKTNLYALHSIKNETQAPFTQATEEDLKILQAADINAPLRRTKWYNPKDNKTYWILKESQEANGDINVRILNQYGGFVKNAVIKPKNIVIADNFQKQDACYINEGNFTITSPPNITHGDKVARFAMINNPFANYSIIDFSDCDGEIERPYFVASKLAHDNKQNPHIDVMNLSWANLLPMEFYDRLKDKTPAQIIYEVQNILDEYDDEEIEAMFFDINNITDLLDSINTLSNYGAKIFVSAGNNGEDDFNFLLLSKNVQGVGSLNEKGKVSNFESSRRSALTKHYEQGEYKVTATKDGINYTGGTHTDFICNLDELYPLNKKRAGKHLVSQKEFEHAMQVKEKSQSDFYEIFDKRVEEKKVLNGSMACIMFQDPDNHEYDDLYVSTGDWIPYTINENGDFEPYLGYICGTSFSSPVRAARYALNESMEGII